MGLSSEQYWLAWEQKLVDELEDRDLALTDVVTQDDVCEMAGWTPCKLGLRDLARRIHLEPPPKPLFVINRTQFWLRGTIEAWLEPRFQKVAERRSAQMERRKEQVKRSVAAARRTNPLPASRSGYRHVALHRPTGLWRAHIFINRKQFSGGYYRSVEDAARCADYLRWQHGFDPINFPDDFRTVTLKRADQWEERVGFGPRGITDKIVETLQGKELGSYEIYAAVEHMDTTLGNVRTTLLNLVKEGRIRRVSVGVYTADTTEVPS